MFEKFADSFAEQFTRIAPDEKSDDKSHLINKDHQQSRKTLDLCICWHIESNDIIKLPRIFLCHKNDTLSKM